MISEANGKCKGKFSLRLLCIKRTCPTLISSRQRHQGIASLCDRRRRRRRSRRRRKEEEDEVSWFRQKHIVTSGRVILSNSFAHSSGHDISYSKQQRDYSFTQQSQQTVSDKTSHQRSILRIYISLIYN